MKYLHIYTNNNNDQFSLYDCKGIKAFTEWDKHLIYVVSVFKTRWDMKKVEIQ